MAGTKEEVDYVDLASEARTLMIRNLDKCTTEKNELNKLITESMNDMRASVAIECFTFQRFQIIKLLLEKFGFLKVQSAVLSASLLSNKYTLKISWNEADGDVFSPHPEDGTLIKHWEDCKKTYFFKCQNSINNFFLPFVREEMAKFNQGIRIDSMDLQWRTFVVWALTHGLKYHMEAPSMGLFSQGNRVLHLYWTKETDHNPAACGCVQQPTIPQQFLLL